MYIRSESTCAEKCGWVVHESTLASLAFHDEYLIQATSRVFFEDAVPGSVEEWQIISTAVPGKL